MSCLATVIQTEKSQSLVYTLQPAMRNPHLCHLVCWRKKAALERRLPTANAYCTVCNYVIRETRGCALTKAVNKTAFAEYSNSFVQMPDKTIVGIVST